MIESVAVGGFVTAGFVVGGVWFFGIPQARRRHKERRIERTCQSAKTLCLTFDDGPGEVLTNRLLDLLGMHEARATFFLLGRRAEAAPKMADQVVASGHEIGCHSHDHLNAWKTLPWRSARDVERGYETLSRWLPERCLFRPPYGKITPWTSRVAKRHGSRLGWWTIDSGDTWAKLPSVQSVVDRVRSAGGGVVLMHDFDRQGGDAAERAEFVLNTTAELLDLAHSETMNIRTLSEALDEMEAGV